jgi:alpha-amylase/alpha-mannosidase (GH57 family)
MFGINAPSKFTEKSRSKGKPVRALCIHGHFYQPPREDPRTGVIPDEIGATPYRNWNERIHSECYRPNAELGNFEGISFNVGPTLFKWMERYDPITYQRILAQDRSNLVRFGAGNAIAQPYHHTILPLASRHDKETQILWGIADFEKRFGHKPDGMWLPETAVDTETLEVLAEGGILFTILAPWQADTEELDPTQPYWVNLPSGRRIAIFFYHGGLSAGVSFNQSMTSNADNFALHDVAGNFNDNGRKQEPQILMVASDGELYGHHQIFRDWFLAYLLNGAGAKAGVQLTYPGLWLREYPPTDDIKILDNTSWSCHHGVERWRGDCDCLAEPGDWKRFLRTALDWLAGRLDSIYVEMIASLGLDPWRLRNEYVQILLGDMDVETLICRQLSINCRPQTVNRQLSVADISMIGLLLKSQYERQRMYTSCGFYFENFERIEPQNSVAYARHAIQLTEQAAGIDLSMDFEGILKQVASSTAVQKKRF